MTKIYTIYIKKEKATNRYTLNLVSYKTDIKHVTVLTDIEACTIIQDEALDKRRETPSVIVWS